MVSSIFISTVVLSVLFILVGALTLSRDPKSHINRLFLFMCFCLAIWLTSNHIAGDTSVANSFSLAANRSTLLFGILSTLLILLFIRNLIGIRSEIINKLHVFVNIVICFACFTPLIVKSVYIGNDTVAIKFGILSGLYFFMVALNAILSIFYIVKGRKEATGALRSQLSIILLSFAIGLIGIIIVNALLPFVFSIYSMTDIGSFFSLSFVLGISYAIIRHKLFDIRLAVARTLGYVLSIGVLAVTYGIVAFIVIDKLIFNANSSSTLKRAVFTMLAVVLATTYSPLRQFFNKLTNKIFYRDAYDSQALLDSFNRSLLTTIDLDKLLKTTANTINEYIKSEYLLFGIKDFKGSPQRVVGTLDIDFAQEDIEKVRKITPLMQAKSIIVDDLPEDQANLKNLLIANGISALVRLTDTPDKKKEGMGYIVLGAKKSGGRYSAQDIRNLEIIADILVIAVQNSLRFEEIQSFNKTLQEKIDDATKKLRSANQRLIELDQTKDDFISMASHQLRTPLTSIKGYVSMVIEGDAGKVSKKQVELLDQAFVSAQRMVYLIADLLNVSRLRTGKFVIDPKQTNLTDIIEGEITQLIETAKGRNLKLVYNKPKSFPVLMLDEVKTRQVIMNFIDNAIYYTPSGGHISVSLADLGESIEFIVTDDGIGVPQAEQHQLFSKFYRANNAKKARPDGTGLGLFMAKKVIVAQGGSIIFKSAENKGSTFGFAFIKKPLLPENFKGVIK